MLAVTEHVHFLSKIVFMAASSDMKRRPRDPAEPREASAAPGPVSPIFWNPFCRELNAQN